MLHIGCHLSSSKGYLAMGKEASKIKADTFQFFSRNPRGSKAKAMDIGDAQALNQWMEEHGFVKILAHAPYTLNACSADERTREFARMAMREDLERLEYLPGNMYNFHPGSHVGQGVETGIALIAEILNEVMEPDQATTVLLETMAGKGSEVGSRFEELRAIIDLAECRDKIGVCLDTCHVFDGGYDIVNDLDGVLGEFDRIIGLDRLKAIHLNDSMNTLGCHKDRHQKIGEGGIGMDAMVRIINHPNLRELPFYLETPNELDGYAREISMLRSAYRQMDRKEKTK